jgi:hypothetical protein
MRLMLAALIVFGALLFLAGTFSALDLFDRAPAWVTAAVWT